MSAPSVLVIGAGELGMAVVQALHDNPVPFQISVMLRPGTVTSTDPAKAASNERLRSLGAQLVPGDFVADSEQALAQTFAPFDTVIGCSGFSHGAAGVQVKMARAVLAAGVRRYVPWQFGVDYDVLGAGSSQDLFDEQLQVRRLLRTQSKTAWVIVSVGVFMTFLFEPWWGVVDLKNDTVRALGSWDTRITTTTPEDIGVATAAIIAEQPEIRDEVCFVAGETLTYGQLAENVERAVGRPMKRELWDVPYLMKELEADPNNGLKKYRPIFASKEGIAWDQATSWNGTRGMKMVSTEDFARSLK